MIQKITFPINPLDADYLKNTATHCRAMTMQMLTQVQSSHLGCSFSIIDILVVLYHAIIDVAQIKQQAIDRDYVILSKGHGASALYAVLCSVGLLPKDMIYKYHQGILAGHPMRNTIYGIEASTGSLGQGLSMAVGMAIAAKHDGLKSKMYVIIGDGECQEGAIWEAINMAVRFKLDNLIVFVDYNNLQGLDQTNTIMTGPLGEKFAAFGCAVSYTNGHEHQALIETMCAYTINQKPHIIIASTIKGKGINFIEDKLEWHYKSLKGDLIMQAEKELK